METVKKFRNGTIRMSIPAKVAYNGKAFKESIYQLLDELGCPKCFSGVDCYIDTFRDYIYDPEKAVLNPVVKDRVGFKANWNSDKFSDGTPVPLPFNQLASNTLTVASSPKLTGSIDKVDSLIDKVFEEIGCRACCSGHDVFFKNVIDTLRIPNL
ncbi:hypothetical protein HX109_06085 [Galbibacter sp. BG1]|uniref:hypothetical protein n=1 Tax=Galbibacter sp. BG1 TaxID=1170699 RepID=UPI0015BADA34|nr:hypothetical protein [Galbibacter sp. BG1]QLE01153.1 hypothetical protein HX109_06085 [Galbibacter sp. BG1]